MDEKNSTYEAAPYPRNSANCVSAHRLRRLEHEKARVVSKHDHEFLKRIIKQ